MFPRPVRDIVRPVRPDVGAGAKKFALRHCSHRVGAKKFAQHAKNASKRMFDGALGELLRGPALAGPRRASLLRRTPGSRAHLLAPLTPQCAAKPHWWHGGQPAQAATYRVNVRIKGAHVRRMRSQKHKRDTRLTGLPTLSICPVRRQRRDPRRVPPLVARGRHAVGAEKSPFQQHVVSYDPHKRRQQDANKKTPADI